MARMVTSPEAARSTTHGSVDGEREAIQKAYNDAVFYKCDSTHSPIRPGGASHFSAK